MLFNSNRISMDYLLTEHFSETKDEDLDKKPATNLAQTVSSPVVPRLIVLL